MYELYIQGAGRSQGTLFPVVLDDLVPSDHVCPVIGAFVSGLRMQELGFARAEPAETGRPGYEPRDLVKLYLYGYLHQIRSSRRLEAECRRNLELMWLFERLYPDHRSIAELADAPRCGDGSRRGTGPVRARVAALSVASRSPSMDPFRAVTSADSVREGQALERYLHSPERADAEQQVDIDPSAVQAAFEKLKQHPEPEPRFMPVAKTHAPAYNVQTAVDAEHALIAAHDVALGAGDNRCMRKHLTQNKKRSLAGALLPGNPLSSVPASITAPAPL